MEHLRKLGQILSIGALGLAAVVGYLSLQPPDPQSSETKPENSKRTSKENSGPAEGQIPDQAELEKLAALGYTNWSHGKTDVRKSGVVHFEPRKAFGGLNLYNSRNLSQAHLIDMDGNVVHSWTVPQKGNESWHTIKMMDDGDLLAVVKDQKLIRLGWNSVIKWEYNARVHHDIALSSEGLIYVPTRRTEMWTTKGRRIPVVKEYITVLTKSGTFVKEISLFDALSPLISEEQILKIHSWAQREDVPDRLKRKTGKQASWWEDKKPDVFHLNSIELIGREIPDVAKEGDFLLSFRQIDLVCIFRESTGELVWSWGPGNIERQHHPVLLENGNILLFDNGCERGYSRVIEVDPKSKSIVWEYSHPKKFFSYRRGGVQRLPNGNTLITESDRGRVFEISRSGKILWEFLNPDVDEEKKRRAVIYRMIRVPDSAMTKQLRKG